MTPEPTKAPVTSVSTDCYDLHGITEEDIINQIGSEAPIPEDAIKIIHGENTNVTIGKQQTPDLLLLSLGRWTIH